MSRKFPAATPRDRACSIRQTFGVSLSNNHAYEMSLIAAAQPDDDGVVRLEVADTGSIFEIAVEEKADFKKRRRLFLVIRDCFQTDRGSVFGQ